MVNQIQEDKNICIDCQTRLGAILTTEHYSEEEIHLLDKPKRMLTFTVPVKMDSGEANVILEMANDPITTDADPLLEKQGVVVIPDIAANAGGVMVSYFEWM